MDQDDRNHFKTIALASQGPSTDGLPHRERSYSRLDPASCLSSAKMIAACYRRDEAQNPELFADALAIVLGDYPVEIVQTAVDPRTGIVTQFPMGLPNVGQIKQFLDDLLTRQEKLSRYAAIPKPAPRRPQLRATRTANLFVPDSSPRYEKLCARHEKELDRGSYFEQRACADGNVKNGLWVPLDWWEQPVKIERKAETETPLQVSEHLKDLLARQKVGT